MVSFGYDIELKVEKKSFFVIERKKIEDNKRLK